MTRAPRIVFWDNVPAPYGVEQYNALAARGSLDFGVWYCRRTDPDRSWNVDEAEWRFRGAYVEDPSRSVADAARFVARCRATAPDLVIYPYGERPFVVGHPILSALGIRTALVVEASFDAVVKRAAWKELAKSVLFRSAEAAHAGPGALDYARRYGFGDERIFVVRQTTDVPHFARRVPEADRARHRAALGVHGCVFLYVGRFVTLKGLDFLIDAFRQARASSDAISLLLVGDGPDEARIRRAAQGIADIAFEPFVQRHALPSYYAAADVFVFPTLGDVHGHVIEEAHAARLPVLTTESAGDVRRRVEDGVSGFVVPPADPAAMAERMLMLAGSPDLRRTMGERGADRVRTWGHDTYVEEIERLVRGCLALPRRSTLAARGVSALGRMILYAAGGAGRFVQRELL